MTRLGAKLVAVCCDITQDVFITAKELRRSVRCYDVFALLRLLRTLMSMQDLFKMGAFSCGKDGCLLSFCDSTHKQFVVIVTTKLLEQVLPVPPI